MFTLWSHYVRLGLRRAAGALALAVLCVCGPLALAQSASTAPAADSGQIEEVTVTATRVQRAGYEAPTPTTVITAESLEQQGLNNIADLLNSVPSFRGSSTPTTVDFAFGSTGGNYVNLRDLGANRTLVLLDGNRIVPSAVDGTTDLNLIPTIAIDHTDVVTGGASAAYGSDAVSGVVNLVLKNHFEGMQAEAQTGESKYGDSIDHRVSILGGTNLFGGSAHLMVAGEYDQNEGIGTQASRPWAAQNVVGIGGPNGTTVISPNVNFSIFAPGGVIIGPTAYGSTFTPNASLTPMIFGNSYGGAAAPFQSGGSNAGTYYTSTLDMEVPVTRYSGLAKLDGDLSENVRGWVELNYGDSGSTHSSVPFLGVVTPSLGIFPGTSVNPFLPSGLVTEATNDFFGGTGAPVVPIGVAGLGGGWPPYVSVSGNQTYRAAAGLEGKLPAGWSWDAHIAYGVDDYSSALHNDVLDCANNGQTNCAWQQATNAVLNASGQIVCAPGSSANCVPFDFIGAGTFSKQALAFVTGTSWQKQTFKQYNATANVHGEPLSDWAGPISVAAGYEYRRNTLKGTSDPLSQEDEFDVYNPQPISGSLFDNEVYAETVVPLLADMPFAKSLDLNAAARESDYNLAGDQTTWKVGLTYVLNSQFRFRASSSRDIRAPNLSENFATAETGQYGPPPTGYSGNPNAALIDTVTSGNTNLEPEKSNTTSFGLTVTPDFARGLHVSADYYDIDIKGAIGSLSVPEIITGCANHVAEDCSLITFASGSTTTIDSIALEPININETKTSGIDFDLGYDFDALSGQFSLSALGSYLQSITSTDCGSTNRAGEIGGGVISACAFDGPRWIWDGNVHYTQGALGLNAHVHYIAAGVLDSTASPGGVNAGKIVYPDGSDANAVAAKYYFNVGADYTLKSDSATRKWVLYGGINNVFNQTPPYNIGFGKFGGGNVANYYDVVGTDYFVGIRLRY